MSDRGYSSMTLEDAKRISVVIGSQDSLDSLNRAPAPNRVVSKPLAVYSNHRITHGNLHKSNFIEDTNFNPLTAAIWGSGYKLFVKWRRYQGVRLERYLQNSAIIRGAG